MQKDRLLQELASKQEEYKEREKEFLHKLEWCEHKMRLLKQDKRRRGETIGKLLRYVTVKYHRSKIVLFSFRNVNVISFVEVSMR